MSEIATTQGQQPATIKSLLTQDNIKSRFNELLGNKAPGFISSIMQVSQSNKLLQSADPQSILAAAVTAASLDLPINQNLGFAWIVPFKGKGQFQMGWRGYVQLALRSGQYERINVIEVYADQFESFNRMTEELDADFSKPCTGGVVGYVAYFKTVNGFEKTCYWTRDECEKHAKKYSQSYKKGYGVWADGESGFDAMAKKTVLKSTLSKWGLMSIELQTAQLADQAVQSEEGQYHYPDNTIDIEAQNVETESARALRFIDLSEDIDQLEMAVDGLDMTDDVKEAYDSRKLELSISKAKEQ